MRIGQAQRRAALQAQRASAGRPLQAQAGHVDGLVVAAADEQQTVSACGFRVQVQKGEKDSTMTRERCMCRTGGRVQAMSLLPVCSFIRSRKK